MVVRPAVSVVHSSKSVNSMGAADAGHTPASNRVVTHMNLRIMWPPGEKETGRKPSRRSQITGDESSLLDTHNLFCASTRSLAATFVSLYGDSRGPTERRWLRRPLDSSCHRAISPMRLESEARLDAVDSFDIRRTFDGWPAILRSRVRPPRPDQTRSRRNHETTTQDNDTRQASHRRTHTARPIRSVPLSRGPQDHSPLVCGLAAVRCGPVRRGRPGHTRYGTSHTTRGDH